MMKHIPFRTLYHADHGWLQSRFHFSFGEYYSRKNTYYGVLRVMNDDVIAAHSGFDTHPHKDMEIITYVLRGALTHDDSMSNKERLGRGAMQYLSADTGISHSEKNEDDEEVHLIQTWILPNAKGKTPQYGSKLFDFEARHNTWLHLVAPEGVEDVTNIYQDANMYVTELDNGFTLDFELGSDRQAYMKVMEGEVSINDFVCREGDAAEIKDENITLKGVAHAHVLMVEMAKVS